MPAPCRVVIVDDHPLIRVGLTLTLGQADDFAVCGEAETAKTACALAEELRPDAMVLDLGLGGRDGTDLIEDLRIIVPDTALLAYTGMPEAHYAMRTILAGARGYLPKRARPEEVVEALRTIGRGGLAVSDAVRHELAAPAARPADDAPSAALLSNRELQVFRFLGEGRTSAEIAAGFGLSIKTVGAYRERIKGKLRLADAAGLEAAARAFVREGIAAD